VNEEKPSLAELSRRRFLKAAAGGGAGLAAWSLMSGQASAAGHPASSPGTGGATGVVMPLNAGWLFGGPWVSASSQAGYDDSSFLPVTLPHVVTPLSWREWDPTTWEKVWIYRRHFGLPPGLRGMRTFVDFQGALTSATPAINGKVLAGHLGGYLPFSYELTGGLRPEGNVLAVAVDSAWQNVPPEGSPRGAVAVDYLQPGGLYRDVALRFVPQVFIADVFAQPKQVLSASPAMDVQCTVDAAVVSAGPVQVVTELMDRGRRLARASAPVTFGQPGQVTVHLQLAGLGPVRLWDTGHPNLYDLVTTVTVAGHPVHDFTRRVGFREARFQTDGFFLNGNRLKLFGLNRHQIFPYAGMAMPARVQRHDAELLKQLNCNMVRCSHYPQSPDFLDACDELGIMIWEETPGWGYLGDAAWQQIMLQNVHDMVVRDRSRPSVIIWGVQPNEAPRDLSLYTQSKNLADALDGSRPTSGTETAHNLTDWDQDVFAFDDYHHSGGDAQLAPPIPDVPYLVTEAVGTLDGPSLFRWIDTQDIQQDQARLHAQVHNIAGSDNAYTGVLGWCAFDYDSLTGNIYENLKWPGVVDTFRVPKPGAAFYLAQGDPAAGAIIEPAFYWYFGPISPVTDLGRTATIWSNCDRLEAYLDGAHFATLTPDTAGYPNLAHPPFYLDVSQVNGAAPPDLRLDGYVGSRLAASRSFAASPEGDHLTLMVDDDRLAADGSDTTRVAFRAVDRYGAPRPYATGNVTVSVDGPAIWLGQVLTLDAAASPSVLRPGQQAAVSATLANGAFPFADNGGVGGVYIRTLPGQPGPITVRVTHPTLGSAAARIVAVQSPSAIPGISVPGPGGARPRQEMTLTSTDMTLSAPGGWSIAATSPSSFAALPPGASVTSTWKLTAPTAASAAGAGSVAVTAAFVLDGSRVSQSTTVPVSVALSLSEAFNNVGISDDSDVSEANFDGVGNSFSAQALAAAGLAPGALFTHGGITFTWPDAPPGQPDNVVANGQTILLNGTGTMLAFVGASSPSVEAGVGVVHYSDGSTSAYSVTLDNYFYAPTPGNETVAQMPYINDSNPASNGGQAGRRNQAVWIFFTSVPIAAGRTVTAVTLPTGGGTQGGRVVGMHVFALGIG
jgi:beta-galactosidase